MFQQIYAPKLAKNKGNGAAIPHNYEQPRTGTVAWIERKIEQSKIEPFAELVTITPAIAKHLLQSNDDNRKLDEARVIAIANDIAEGRWQLNGETIIISRDGQMNNGQHRLNAIILAEEPVQSLVFFGAERDSRMTVDMGKPRTVSDFLGMQKVKNSSIAAASAKLLLTYTSGRYSINNRLASSKQELRDMYFANEDKLVRAISAVGHHRFAKRAGATSFVVAYAVLYDVNPKACKEFFEKLLDGEAITRGDAILQARAHVMEFSQQRIREHEKLELILKYWNSWRAGKTMSRNHFLSREWPVLED